MQTFIPKQIQITLSLSSLLAAGLIGGWSQSSAALPDVTLQSEPVFVSASHSGKNRNLANADTQADRLSNNSERGKTNPSTLRLQSEQNFATGEIAHYEELIATLTERAEQESDPALLAKIQSGLTLLSHEVDQSRKALKNLRHADGVKEKMFAQEDVHEALLAMQDSGAALLQNIVVSDRASSEASHDITRTPLSAEKPSAERLGGDKQSPRQLVTSAAQN